eukprot:1138003-Pelagomonas_calceolata.AAC.6
MESCYVWSSPKGYAIHEHDILVPAPFSDGYVRQVLGKTEQKQVEFSAAYGRNPNQGTCNIIRNPCFQVQHCCDAEAAGSTNKAVDIFKEEDMSRTCTFITTHSIPQQGMRVKCLNLWVPIVLSAACEEAVLALRTKKTCLAAATFTFAQVTQSYTVPSAHLCQHQFRPALKFRTTMPRLMLPLPVCASACWVHKAVPPTQAAIQLWGAQLPRGICEVGVNVLQEALGIVELIQLPAMGQRGHLG